MSTTDRAMAKLEQYRKAVQTVLLKYAQMRSCLSSNPATEDEFIRLYLDESDEDSNRKNCI